MDSVDWALLLGGFLVWLVPIGFGAVAGSVAVLVVGPRDVDSLIVPGMVSGAASFVALFELGHYGWMAAAGVAVAAATAVGQRWVLARFDTAATSRPWIRATLTVVAAALVGSFFGYAAGRRVDPELMFVGACLGAAAGAAASLALGRPEGDPG